ncbi:uncharacterized protein TNIN_208581 [Trichonephila inaurata madagascariensis]|uniref:CUB domain-containing protein n=1 Tax=Trichonephila inaurata madagascariensis TaxID=2747483 RepID=A0A8X6XGM5_9ARAC|nr:uncharacterized protein TNIN_208581 [Trichonephila inaurata madagascariensis]
MRLVVVQNYVLELQNNLTQESIALEGYLILCFDIEFEKRRFIFFSFCTELHSPNIGNDELNIRIQVNQTSVCQKGYLKISEWSDSSSDWDDDTPLPVHSPGRYSSVFPRVLEESATRSAPNFGEFCGSMIERSVTFFSQGSNVSVMAVVPSRASIPSTSFSLYLTYRFLKRRPSMESGQISFLGNPVPGTFCDREFLDCHTNRRCRIRTPNFPGFYPRNVTCHFYIRHPKAPEVCNLL